MTQRLRDLLRKRDVEMKILDLDPLIRDVVRLLGRDPVIRDVKILLDLDALPALVKGDRVQLRHVVLNVLLNAMDAMADAGKHERRLTVRTRRTADRMIRVSVEDTGPGLRAGTED